MRVLVVWAHPLEGSFSAVLCKTAVEALTAAGHQVDVWDLYREGFNPVLGPQERRLYHDKARNHQHLIDDIARVQAAEGLVFVFPTWNFGFPAILKGWFDRTLIPGVAFHMEPTGLKPGLTHVRKLAAVTTFGAKDWMVRFVIGHPVKKLMARGLMRLCAPGTRCDWLALYNMNANGVADRQAHVAKVQKVLGAW